MFFFYLILLSYITINTYSVSYIDQIFFYTFLKYMMLFKNVFVILDTTSTDWNIKKKCYIEIKMILIRYFKCLFQNQKWWSYVTMHFAWIIIFRLNVIFKKILNAFQSNGSFLPFFSWILVVFLPQKFSKAKCILCSFW